MRAGSVLQYTGLYCREEGSIVLQDCIVRGEGALQKVAGLYCSRGKSYVTIQSLYRGYSGLMARENCISIHKVYRDIGRAGRWILVLQYT